MAAITPNQTRHLSAPPWRIHCYMFGKGDMNAKIVGLLIGIVVTPIALSFAMRSAGAGHGNYLAARVLFPSSMLTTHLFEEITVPAIALACIQFPVYGCVIGAGFKTGSRKLWPITVGFHAITLALIFIFPDPSFS
jgi:hypothetical protein